MSLLGLGDLTFLNTMFVVRLYSDTLHAIKQSKDNLYRRKKLHDKIDL